MAKILITGGTGLVGSKLTELLIAKKHTVRILSRSPENKNEFKWNVSSSYIDEKALENIDYIIHLAGAGIADKRWTDERKKIIISSRVDTANLLFNKVKELKIPLKGFISASGSNYYGAKTTDKIFKETDSVGDDFLGEVCKKWENAAHQFKKLNIPVTILRTGVVLSKKGGALERMKTPIISPLGSGNQYMSWIHVKDLCNLYIKAIEEDFVGVFNVVAPEFHTSKTFSKTLAKVIKRPYLPISVPSFLLKLFFGELAVILLEGSRLSSKKIKEEGFTFTYDSLEKALENL
ncbi:TIGR01777 family oxidoreductase [Polaribacter batillariae]|uniref:TIGR01777 family oxidoreductase n=1 Tax=Polaribacter batillariae TaxID=2808900 RepID=A0ABX7SWC2_9FLAO|nr:TIGR01777 family oxidoreductase [Polaribacter batillariae]QTD37153.1 TIGR01777 family oxidoreductase [Polaribacter batillariae]